MKLRLARKIAKGVGERCLTAKMVSICPHKWGTHRRSMKRLMRSMNRGGRS